MQETVKRRATYADIEALPPHVVGEILFGELSVHPRPAPRHGAASVGLGIELGGPFQRGRGGPGGWVFFDEPELHLGPHVVVPDLAGWRRERMPAMNDERRVWDLPVRVFHWSLVLAVAGAWCTNQLGVAYFAYHVWCGYAVLVLVAFRLLWGFVGTRHARFAQFLRGPRATLRYAAQLVQGSAPHVAGHNPLGAWMIMGLLAALLAQALLGLFGNDEIFNFGPLYGYVSNARSVALTSLHRRLFYGILAAIVLHVAADREPGAVARQGHV